MGTENQHWQHAILVLSRLSAIVKYAKMDGSELRTLDDELNELYERHCSPPLKRDEVA
jgi:hypothetical protein